MIGGRPQPWSEKQKLNLATSTKWLLGTKWSWAGSSTAIIVSLLLLSKAPNDLRGFLAINSLAP